MLILALIFSYTIKNMCRIWKFYLTCRSICATIILRQSYYDYSSKNIFPERRERAAVYGLMPESMISSDVIRGYNDTIILNLLQRRPSYGYEISKEIRQISEEKYIIKETTLYSAFTRMEKNGYIESFFGNDTGKKRRTYYRITDSGLDYYKKKCDEWAVTKEVIDKFVV